MSINPQITSQSVPPLSFAVDPNTDALRSNSKNTIAPVVDNDCVRTKAQDICPFLAFVPNSDVHPFISRSGIADQTGQAGWVVRIAVADKSYFLSECRLLGSHARTNAIPLIEVIALLSICVKLPGAHEYW